MMLEAIREHQKKYPNYVGAYALEFQIATAMRRGEIPPLTWSDIVEDSEYGFIRITKEQITVKSDKPGDPEKFVIVHHTKTYKDRRFPITREVRVCLEKIQMLHDTYYPESTFLFPAENDNGCITNNVVYQLYRRICRKLGIKLSREFIKGTHSFRRNAISKVANASNGGLAMAAELYGNSPQVAYANYYTGVNLESAKNVLDA